MIIKCSLILNTQRHGQETRGSVLGSKEQQQSRETSLDRSLQQGCMQKRHPYSFSLTHTHSANNSSTPCSCECMHTSTHWGWCWCLHPDWLAGWPVSPRQRGVGGYNDPDLSWCKSTSLPSQCFTLQTLHQQDLSLSLSLSLSHTNAHTHMVCHTLISCFTITHLYSPTLYSLYTHSHSYTQTHTLSFSLSHTHRHTITNTVVMVSSIP